MPSTTRRHLLRIGCLTATGSVAGCTDFTTDGADETRLTFLLFHNLTDEVQHVDVRIENGTTTLYEETVTTEPRSTDLLPPDTVRSEGFPTDPGSYEIAFRLHARADDQGQADFDLGTVDDGCVGYTAEMTTGRTEDDPRLNVFPNTGCDQGRAGDEAN